MCRGYWLFVFLLFISSNVYSQKINADYTLQIKEVEDPIIIDGELNEATCEGHYKYHIEAKKK